MGGLNKAYISANILLVSIQVMKLARLKGSKYSLNALYIPRTKINSNVFIYSFIYYICHIQFALINVPQYHSYPISYPSTPLIHSQGNVNDM